MSNTLADTKHQGCDGREITQRKLVRVVAPDLLFTGQVGFVVSLGHWHDEPDGPIAVEFRNSPEGLFIVVPQLKVSSSSKTFFSRHPRAIHFMAEELQLV